MPSSEGTENGNVFSIYTVEFSPAVKGNEIMYMTMVRTGKYHMKITQVPQDRSPGLTGGPQFWRLEFGV